MPFTRPAAPERKSAYQAVCESLRSTVFGDAKVTPFVDARETHAVAESR